ncbi:MAG: pyruvate kinase, partial [bacterium]
GPSSDSEEVLERLFEAGMNVARLNFSHGTAKEHGERITKLRSLSEKRGVPVAVLQDLAGPKIRVGRIEKGPLHLQSGEDFVLTCEDVPGDEKRVSITYSRLPKEVKADDRILLADGSIELRVLKTDANNITCKVLVGGELSSHKGINVPGGTLSVEAFTEKDRVDLEFGLDRGVDYVAMSFVRRREDILQLKKVMEEKKRFAPIIAKIEKHEALENLEEILQTVDGVMVARGDLAVETALERVPLVQKMLIQKCNQIGKPVITATQMLKSMVDNPRPTRAEANDVANAVLDGTDAVMLSEETTVGKYPVESVRTMAKIIEATESNQVANRPLSNTETEEPTSIAKAVSHASFEMARDLKAAAIFTPTQTGSTARSVASFRPAQPIIALSPNPNVVRCLNLVWGLHPILVGQYSNSDEMIEQAKTAALNTGLVKKGDMVVITAGIPVGKAGTTNLIKAEVLE